jgi:hypothetical protein
MIFSLKNLKLKVKSVSFFLKIISYTLPFAIPFLLTTGSLIYVGESMPLEVVIQMQASDEPVLYRVGYGNRDQDYKLMSVEYRQPEVMMIGSSRVLQFRGQFLNNEPDVFYNAAAPAWRLPELRNLLFNMQHRPNVIIIGMDYPWFNDAYQGDPIVEPPANFWKRVFVVNRTYIQEVLAGEDFDLPLLFARDEPGGSGGMALGQRAIIDGQGFRNDGSEQYGDFLVAQHLWQPNLRDKHLGLFENGEDMYVEGDTVSETEMNQMRAILDWAQAEDILIIGMLPPYMPSLWEQMIVSERHTYIPQAQMQLNELFAEYNFPLFDYSNGADVGATDEDFFDGWHSSERIALQVYINIVREVPELQPYSDLDALQEIVDTASDTFRVLPFVAP